MVRRTDMFKMKPLMLSINSTLTEYSDTSIRVLSKVVILSELVILLPTGPTAYADVMPCRLYLKVRVTFGSGAAWVRFRAKPFFYTPL